jgi:hypothetical protein
MGWEWEKQIPHIEDGNVRWAVLYIHNVEEYWDFERWAEEIRETCRKDPERREKYEEAYRYLVEHTPSTREWSESTHTPFCGRAQLHEYLKAFYDYVFGDRPEPIEPPSNEEPCEHDERDENGDCVIPLADGAQEENR